MTYDVQGLQVPAITSLGIGIDNHGKGPPGNDVYLDDVAIDANRIGCLP